MLTDPKNGKETAKYGPMYIDFLKAGGKSSMSKKWMHLAKLLNSGKLKSMRQKRHCSQERVFSLCSSTLNYEMLFFFCLMLIVQKDNKYLLLFERHILSQNTFPVLVLSFIAFEINLKSSLHYCMNAVIDKNHATFPPQK